MSLVQFNKASNKSRVGINDTITRAVMGQRIRKTEVNKAIKKRKG